VKNLKLISALALAVLTFGSTQVVADEDQPWHLSYQVGGARWDDARLSRDGDIWQSVGFGRFFGNNFSLDIEYDTFTGDLDPAYVQSVEPGATYEDWKLSTWGLMGRYYFTNNKVRPYLALGLGRTKHRNVMSEDTDTSFSYGLGLRAQFSKHVSGRLQLIRRVDNDNSSMPPRGSFRDYYFSVGLNFDFGGSEPPPPPPPPPPPAAKPEPVNPDLDGDGVLNERDKCPNTRPGAVVDLDGCEVEAVIELKGVHFDFDKATLRPEAIAILNDAATLLNQHERVVVEVAGHTDSKGSEEYNQGLSERRADAVRDFLVSKGVRASRLTSRGYGELRPVASNDTDEGRQENRRVELIVLDR
jgi:OOP family OmpA-OmpF porin